MQTLSSQSSFAVVSNSDEGYAELARLTYPNRQRYASIHGYQHLSFSHGGPGGWGKLPALLEAWGAADWLLWLDTDSIITNPNRSLDTFISDERADCVLTCDCYGLNTGVMLLRTSDRMRRAVQGCWDNRGAYWWGPWSEQTALAYRLWCMTDAVRIVPQRALNSYPEGYGVSDDAMWREGDFVLHCPGMDNGSRMALFRNVMALCEDLFSR